MLGRAFAREQRAERRLATCVAGIEIGAALGQRSHDGFVSLG